MQDPQNLAEDVDVEAKSRWDAEQAEELSQRIRQLIEQGDLVAALALFRELHPADQGQVLAALAREPRQELLSAIPPKERCGSSWARTWRPRSWWRISGG